MEVGWSPRVSNKLKLFQSSPQNSPNFVVVCILAVKGHVLWLGNGQALTIKEVEIGGQNDKGVWIWNPSNNKWIAYSAHMVSPNPGPLYGILKTANVSKF